MQASVSQPSWTPSVVPEPPGSADHAPHGGGAAQTPVPMDPAEAPDGSFRVACGAGAILRVSFYVQHIHFPMAVTGGDQAPLAWPESIHVPPGAGSRRTVTLLPFRDLRVSVSVL